MAAGLPLPKSVHAHGWLLFEESKMSKSRGNIVRAETILEGFGALKPDAPKAEQDLFGADALRYFLLREIAFGQDGSFSFDALVQRYNADLANGYGNLVSRTLSMIGRYFDGLVPYPASSGSVVQSHSFAVELPRTISTFAASFEALDFSRALETAWAAVAAVDGYLTANAPWKQLEGVTDEQQQALRADILYTAAEAIRIITALVYPVIPNAAAQVWSQLGLGDISTADLQNLQWRGLKPGTKLGELSPLFPRADKETITRMSELEQKNAPAASPEPTDSTSAKPAGPEPRISKLHSLVDGLAVAITESTTETAAVVAIENAIAETVRETIGVRKDKVPAAPAAAPQPTPSGPEDARQLPGTRTLPPAPATGTLSGVAPAATRTGSLCSRRFHPSRREDLHRRLLQSRAPRRPGQSRRARSQSRQTAPTRSRSRHRNPPDPRRHRRGLRAGIVDRTQGRHRGQPCARGSSADWNPTG